MLKTIVSYINRIIKFWIWWFWAPVLDIIGGITDYSITDYFIPGWVYILIPLVGFVVANIKLYVTIESEKQELQKRIDDYEDTRADIQLKVLNNTCYHSSGYIKSPLEDLDVQLSPQTGLDKNGMPGWISIWAELQGMNQSHERGELVWEVIEANLPPILSIDMSNHGSFHACPGGLIIDEWKDYFRTEFTLPIRINERENPNRFANSLKDFSLYKIIIEYYTSRGIEEISKKHILIIEGDFKDLVKKICETWLGYGFDDLAHLAECT